MSPHLTTEQLDHITDPVAWLEKDYDDWKYLHYTVDNVTYTRLAARSMQRQQGTGPFAHGPSHDQAPIRLKEDGPRGGNLTDEQVWEIYKCFGCPPVGYGHQCDECRTAIPHMAGTLCTGCWLELEAAELVGA